MSEPAVREVGPQAAWDALSAGEPAVLIDVRTRAEWSFVGVPLGPAGLRPPVLVEWQRFPSMEVNPSFADEALAAIDAAGAATAFFICRSGVRSMRAAELVAAKAAAMGRALNCVNVATGFEGDLDASGHRGRANGWKAAGLPWRQS